MAIPTVGARSQSGLNGHQRHRNDGEIGRPQESNVNTMTICIFPRRFYCGNCGKDLGTDYYAVKYGACRHCGASNLEHLTPSHDSTQWYKNAEFKESQPIIGYPSMHKCRFVRWKYIPSKAADEYGAVCVECGTECRRQLWARVDGSIEDLQESDAKNEFAIKEREAQLARLK